MPLYLKMDSTNFLDQETDNVSSMFIILFMALQLIVMKFQQTHGPRWFVPKSLRRNRNAHEYYHSVPSDVLKRAKNCKDPTAQTNHEDDVTCVICMNYLHFDVDENGGLIRTDSHANLAVAQGAQPDN